MENREKAEFVTLMNEWSQTKSRLEEEISRRNESNTFGSRFQRRAFVPRAKSASMPSSLSKKFTSGELKKGITREILEAEEDLDIKDDGEISEKSQEQENDQEADNEGYTVYRETGFKKVGQPEIFDFSKIRPKSVATGQEIGILKSDPLEDKINKLKVQRITKLHSDLIFGARNVATDVGQDGAYSVDRPKSLSIYDQSKVTKYRPFSAAYETAKPETFRKNQMQEIEEIKSKLAKFKIKVPVKQLQTSILLPELALTQASFPKLPTPGASLLRNPFYKEKKGRKKGSKKKK
jgi:hypothetical protein